MNFYRGRKDMKGLHKFFRGKTVSSTNTPKKTESKKSGSAKSTPKKSSKGILNTLLLYFKYYYDFISFMLNIIFTSTLTDFTKLFVSINILPIS